MTIPGQVLRDEELHAFIDGELDPERADAIARMIESRPELAERIAGWTSDKARVMRSYGPLIDQPAPPALVALAGRHGLAAAPIVAPSPKRSRRRLAIAIAAGVVALIAAAAGWRTLTRVEPDAIVAEAENARDGAQAPVAEMAGADLPGPEGRREVLQTTLTVPAPAPDLSGLGYYLIKMGIYPRAGGRAVQLSYRDRSGRLFTIYYAQRAAAADHFELIERGGMRLCIWRTRTLSAVMVGEISGQDMLRVADVTYATLGQTPR